MNNATCFFSKFPVLLPVIHVHDSAQAIRNAQIAFEIGCEGIFLINHNIPYQILIECHKEILGMFPEKWIGINCLDLSAKDMFDLDSLQEIQGIWVDDPLLREESTYQLFARQTLIQIAKRNWKGLYFGSVAFKYQPAVMNLEKMTGIACDYMDVITTSGPATGKPPELEKIRIMKKAMGNKSLAIASGIDHKNIIQFIPFADFFLVATSISKSFFEIDPKLLSALLDKVKKLTPGQEYPNENDESIKATFSHADFPTLLSI